MNHLLHFLTDIAINPKNKRQFDKNPTIIMNAAELSDFQQIALISQKQLTMATVSNDDLAVDALTEVLGACIWFDPGPDPTPDPDPTPPDDGSQG